jgi:hypothetical protein
MILRLIGYWKGNNKNSFGGKHYPDPAEMVDENWDKEIKGKVIAYLENGILHSAQRGWSSCRFCGKSNGSTELTDGVFIWPEGLVHYLKEHQVRLPRMFVQHCLTYKFDEKVLKKELENWWDNQGGVSNIRQDWWKSFVYRDYNDAVNWRIEPDVEDDETDILVVVGFWKGDKSPFDEDSNYPRPENFVDEKWDEATRKKVVQYMKNCTVIKSEEVLSHDECLFTGKKLSNRVLCDGRYMFPENYIHYIENHQVRPLDCFTERALSHTKTWEDNIATFNYEVEIDWWESFQVLE